MAMSALAAHKLRSALTLLGVLVGVFSIIVVMTAMRVMQSDIEQQMSQLGSHTFMVQKWPAMHFGGPEGYGEILAAQKHHARARLAARSNGRRWPRSVGIETAFWGGQVETRYKKTAPNVQLVWRDSRQFSRPGIGSWRRGGCCWTWMSKARATYASWATAWPRPCFRMGRRWASGSKINGINYTVVGVLEAKGGSLGGDQDNFAVVPVTTGLNRFGRWNRSLSILVQAPDQARYEDTVEEVRGILRVMRKVPPGKEDDFEISRTTR